MISIWREVHNYPFSTVKSTHWSSFHFSLMLIYNLIFFILSRALFVIYIGAESLPRWVIWKKPLHIIPQEKGWQGLISYVSSGKTGPLTCLLQPFLSLAAVTASLQVVKPIFCLCPCTVLIHVSICCLLSTSLLVPRLKGNCHDKAHARSWLTPFFEPIEIIVILSRVPRIRPESAWSFTCLS